LAQPAANAPFHFFFFFFFFFFGQPTSQPAS
jgi:hypothetical protein